MEDLQILPACETTGAPAQQRKTTPRRILVVDDDVATRRLETSVLIQSGYEVDVAEDGAAAWSALNTDHYDLLITDHSMPKVTGVELLQKLHDTRMALPVIMVTGSLPQAEFDRLPWLLPATTLLKPYSPEKLLGAVKQILSDPEKSTGGSQNQFPCAP